LIWVERERVFGGGERCVLGPGPSSFHTRRGRDVVVLRQAGSVKGALGNRDTWSSRNCSGTQKRELLVSGDSGTRRRVWAQGKDKQIKSGASV